MRAKGRVALLAVLVAGVVGAVVPASASALISNYNCVLKPVGQWCDGRANGSFDGLHSWDYNQATYPGAPGVVTVCERVWRPSTGGVLGSACYPDFVWQYFGSVSCACYEANVSQYSGGPHSINGYADTY